MENSFKDYFFQGEPLCKIKDCEFWGKQYITPELAKEILTTNVNNRPLNKRRVKIYARQMKQNRWGNIADGILLSFDKKSNLTNGQTRLNAIIESDTPLEMFIVRNGETEAGALELPFDTGLLRSTSNITGNSGRFEAPIKLLIRLFAPQHPILVTADEIVAFENSLTSDEHYVLEKLSLIGFTGFSAAIRAAFFFWFVSTGDKDTTINLANTVTHNGPLSEKESAIQRCITRTNTQFGGNAMRLSVFFQAYALLSERKNTQPFRDELLKKVRGWIIGRY